LCGIIGITSARRRNVVPDLVEGLRRLEYRGYDSVGIAVHDGERIIVRKAAGTIDEFVRRGGASGVEGPTGIGHTRWATHGPPTDYNAHPHLDCRGEVALVHNGVIRNYSSLREELAGRGHRLASDTDTELIAHLIEEGLSRGLGFLDALAGALSRLEGSYALAILHRGAPRRVYFAKNRSPLLVGYTGEEAAVASDLPAILSVTRRVLPLEDGEFGYVEPGRLALYRLTPGGGYEPVPEAELERRWKTVDWSPEAASKGGYPHFMIKEILEQPQALVDTYNGSAEEPMVARAAEAIAGAGKVVVVGAGTSYHAGLVFHYFLSRLAGIASHPVIASEHRVLEPAVGDDTVVVAVSQSGETYDTLEAVEAYKARGARVIGVTNVVGSALSRTADLTLYTRAGPEIGVAATKTYLTQVLLLEILAVRAGEAAGRLDGGEARSLIGSLQEAPRVVQSAIEAGDPPASELARRGLEGSLYIIGRGLGAVLAREAALKVKEIAYLHAAGESKHGPIALVEEGFPVFVVATSDAPEVAGNAIEMRARGAWVTVTKPAGLHLELPRDVEVLDFPPAGNLLLEPYSLIPFYQLAAYHLAVAKGYDPDKPRNLAKTVTVE